MALDRHIWALADSRLKSQKQHAEDRRTVPGKTEGNIAQIIEQAQLADAEAAAVIEKIPDEEEHAQLGTMVFALLLRLVVVVPSETWSPHNTMDEDFRHFCATTEELKQVRRPCVHSCVE